ncbi:MAG: hypothetical protein ACFB0B_08780 [Thermonemataceae bacterium]
MNERNEVKIGVGAGGVLLGMNADEVISTLGNDYQKESFEEEKLFYLSYYKQGIAVAFTNNLVDVIFLYSGLVGGYETGQFQRFECQIAPSITMDATYEEVIDVFGQPLKEGDLSGADIPSKWLHYEGIGFNFVIESGQIIYISIS